MEHGPGSLAEDLRRGLTRNVGQTLRLAGTAMESLRWVVLPNLGLELLEWEFLDPLGIPLERTLWDWGRRVGHLGPGDQLAGLAHLVERHAVRPGDLVLLVSVGIGFNWTSAVVEITTLPVDNP